MVRFALLLISLHLALIHALLLLILLLLLLQRAIQLLDLAVSRRKLTALLRDGVLQLTNLLLQGDLLFLYFAVLLR